MSVYRWYLLYHQIVTLMADVAYNFVARPVIFLPFVGGYSMSIFRELIPAHWMTVYCCASTVFSIATFIHLLWFRYLTVKRLDKKPIHYLIRITFLYGYSTVVSVVDYWSMPDTEKVIEAYSKEYACVGEYLLEIEGFIMYDWKAFAPFIIPYVGAAYCIFEGFYLIIFSLRETYLPNMSPQLAQMNRKFLIQLVVQGGTPLAIVAIPFFSYLFSVVGESSSLGQGFGHILVAATGSFSTTSAVALIAMNKSYRPKFLQKKLDTIFVAPIASNTSHVSRIA